MVGKTPKKSWADIVKRDLVCRGVSSKMQRFKHMSKGRGVPAKRESTVKSKHPANVFCEEVPKSFEFGHLTTGHANSPAPIFIHNKTSKTPRIYRKGRKSPFNAGFTKSQGNYGDLDGLDRLMATPRTGMREIEISPNDKTNSSEKLQNTPLSKKSNSKPRSRTPSPLKINGSSTEEFMGSLGASPVVFPTTPSQLKSFPRSVGKRPHSRISILASCTNMTNFDFSSIKTPDITKDNFISPLVTPSPSASSKLPENLHRGSSKSFMVSPENIQLETDATTFDFENAQTPDFSTPNVSQVEFPSPVSTQSNHLASDVNNVRNSLMTKYNNAVGRRALLLTPKAIRSFTQGLDSDLHEIKRLPRTLRAVASTPKPDYNVNVMTSIRTKDISERRKTRTPENPNSDNTYSDVVVLDCVNDKHTPKIRKSQTPRSVLDSPSVGYTNGDSGKLIKNMKIAVPEASNDTCNTATKVPVPDYSNIQGLQSLFRTPRRNPENVEIKANYCEPRGLKKLLATPKQKQYSPFADYTNVAGIKNLFASQIPVNSPEANYTNLYGIQTLMKTPNALDSLEREIEVMGELVKTPLSDRTNKVVRKIAPLLQHSPTQSLGRILRSSPKVVSPGTSSPSENIPPVEDGTPRRSRRNAKVELEAVAMSVRQRRPRRGAVKSDAQSHVTECELESIKLSPVVPERSLRSRKKVDSTDKNAMNKKKSRKGEKTAKVEIQNSVIMNKYQESPQIVEVDVELSEVSGKVEITQRQPAFSPEIDNPSLKLKLDTPVSVEDLVSDTLLVKRRNTQKAELNVLVVSPSKRRRKINNAVLESGKAVLPVLQDSETCVSLGKQEHSNDSELTPDLSVPVRGKRRKNQSPNQDEKKQMTPVRRGRSRKVTTAAGNSITDESNKIETQSKHIELNIDPVLCRENLDLSPSRKRNRKTRAQCVKSNDIQEEREVSSQSQDAASTRSRRGKLKEITESEQPLTKGRRKLANKLVSVPDAIENMPDLLVEQEVRITRRGRTRVQNSVDESVPVLQETKMKRGGTRLKNKKLEATVEPLEESEKEMDENCRVLEEPSLDKTSTKAKKNDKSRNTRFTWSLPGESFGGQRPRGPVTSEYAKQPL
ncbi:uncharacterized protein [Cherax quadricarinatus]|uniref:uncharacterized protein n=1 Tax=Cherax quadricarinatus TaxID=27406 RepID=UPI00387EDED3